MTKKEAVQECKAHWQPVIQWANNFDPDTLTLEQAKNLLSKAQKMYQWTCTLCSIMNPDPEAGLNNCLDCPVYAVCQKKQLSEYKVFVHCVRMLRKMYKLRDDFIPTARCQSYCPKYEDCLAAVGWKARGKICAKLLYNVFKEVPDKLQQIVDRM